MGDGDWDGDGNGDGTAEQTRRLNRMREAAIRYGRAARDIDASPGLRAVVQRLRRVLPGDQHFGDPLSLGGARHAEFAGRTIVGLTGDRPSVLRELGLGGLQMWQSLLERLGKGAAEHEVTLVFTDLVEFSRWALEAGDDEVLRVLREVSDAWETPVTDSGGVVVKRLGDGMMAAFGDPDTALAAVVRAQHRLATVRVDGWRPRMRAGLHIGRPRRVGGDYLGVAVNTAARLGERAKAGEILVSGELLDRLDTRSFTVRRKRWGVRLKGAPDGLTVHSLRPAD